MDGFVHLIFPETCLACENELAISEDGICSLCYAELQFTYFEDSNVANALDQLFWGRVPIEQTFSLLYYDKQSSSKPLLQALKYHHRPDVGVQFGRMIGQRIQSAQLFQEADILLPVPLHPKKAYLRGYNQSEKLAEGISQQIGVPIDNSFLMRSKNDKSQTKLGRFKRWDNVANKFSLTTNSNSYEHVILVDDVITTGATLETIAKEIKERFPSIRISVISLALAK